MASRQMMQPWDGPGMGQGGSDEHEGYKRQLSSRRGRVMCRWNWFQFATKDATINGNLRNATAETELEEESSLRPLRVASHLRPVPVQLRLQLWHWHWLWLPNGVLMRCQIGWAGQEKQWRRTGWPVWQEWSVGNACKRPNYIKSCINHEQRPRCHFAACLSLAKTNLAAILCFKCRTVLLLLPSVSISLLRYFRSAAANEFLFASDGGVKSSARMNFSALCRRQSGPTHVLVRIVHSPIIT